MLDFKPFQTVKISTVISYKYLKSLFFYSYFPIPPQQTHEADFEKRWSAYWQDKYNFILESSDHTVMVSQAYSRSCYQIRNEWMVNHSRRVIAVFNGEKSGTKNTVDYAIKHGVEVRNVL